MNIFLIPDLLRIAGEVKTAITTGTSFKDIVAKIENPELLTHLTDLGAQLFPSLAPELHAVAGIVTAYDSDHTKWLQGALNSLVVPSPNISVDGIYGDETIKAVKALQEELGIKADGWVGDVTSAGLQMLVAKNKTVAIAAT